MDLKENQIASAITSFPSIQPYNLFPALGFGSEFLQTFSAVEPLPALPPHTCSYKPCQPQLSNVTSPPSHPPGTNPSRTTYSGDSWNSLCAGHLTTLKTAMSKELSSEIKQMAQNQNWNEFQSILGTWCQITAQPQITYQLLNVRAGGVCALAHTYCCMWVNNTKTYR